ncbi:InlB B-repeat-containing protein, partial [Listeria monocytogenes]|uniref:InlB B-repeat-containing protein n=1 Tax=Listeria monocytogenes TaxID=1639 RepID=UPI000E7132C1
LPNLTWLELNNNQISDLTPLVNLPNLTWLGLNNNQISDLTSLANLPNLDALFLDNQNISASKVKWNDPLSVTNTIKDENGNLIAPSSISDQGTYTDPTITWIGLINTTQQVNYEWSQSVTIGTATTTFDGRFNLPVEKIVKYNVNYDIDGQVTTELIEAGELVTRPQDPSKDGYAFTGWYDAKTGGNKWDFTTNTMPPNDITLHARFNKLGFVTPEIKPVMPNVVTPIMPGVDPVTPSVKPPTTPGEGPNIVSPLTPGSGGNQPPSNGSGSNTGNTTITSQENTKTSPEASQQSKLAQLGEQNSMILQGFGLLILISGLIFFWKKRTKIHS